LNLDVGKEEKHAVENGSPTTAKKTRYKKQAEVDIDFTSFLDKDMPDIFAPPKNPKSLLLPANRAPCNIRLPEDCHYQPESLVKLFLLPDVMVSFYKWWIYFFFFNPAKLCQ